MTNRLVISKDLKLTTLGVEGDVILPFYPTQLPTAPSRVGSLAYLGADNTVYFWNGTQWVSVSGSSVSLSSLGGQTSLVVNGASPLLTIKSLQAGVGINLDTTTPNVVTIENTASASSLASVGGGLSLVENGTPPLFQIKSLQSGTNINITTSLGGPVAISCDVLNSIATNNWKAGTGSGTGGGQDNIAIGQTATITGGGNHSVALGSNSLSVQDAVAVGYNSSATSAQGVSIGMNSQATGLSGSIAIGQQAIASAPNAISLGQGVINSDQDTALIGNSTVFITKSSGLFQSARQWFAIARSTTPQTIAGSNTTNQLVFAAYNDPYNAVVANTPPGVGYKIELPLPNQLYLVTVNYNVQFPQYVMGSIDPFSTGYLEFFDGVGPGNVNVATVIFEYDSSAPTSGTTITRPFTMTALVYTGNFTPPLPIPAYVRVQINNKTGVAPAGDITINTGASVSVARIN